MKNKFSKWAIVMGAVLVLMSAIPVVGAACLFCDEDVEETTEIVVPEEVTIPDTDVL